MLFSTKRKKTSIFHAKKSIFPCHKPDFSMPQARKSVRSPDPNYGKLRKSRVTVINKGLLKLQTPTKSKTRTLDSLRDVIPQSVDFFGESEMKTLDVPSGFWMLDMRWKGFERLVRMSQVSAQGDAAFLSFSSREVPYIIAQNTS